MKEYCAGHNSHRLVFQSRVANIARVTKHFEIFLFAEVGCNVAGFLTVFSSQLSIFTLCVITLERWFAITYAIDLNKRLRLGAAAHVMAAGWIYALTMAILPLAGVSSYSSTR